MYLCIYLFIHLVTKKLEKQLIDTLAIFFCTSASSNRLPTKQIEWFKILLAKRNSPEQFGLDGDFWTLNCLPLGSCGKTP